MDDLRLFGDIPQSIRCRCLTLRAEKRDFMRKEELRYLERLAELYPTIGKASTEIINLQSILNLPKGIEHFLSDLHGEYEAFSMC